MGQIRIADLPSISSVDASYFVIIEKPGLNEGTFKATVGQIQTAVTVSAKVEQVNNVTTIKIDDINGHTEASIVTPTAKVVDNGDNTYTITITDTNGRTQTTAVSRVVLDLVPTQNSSNMVTSGTIYNSLAQRDQTINALSRRLDEANQLIAALTSRVDALTRLSQYVLTTQDDV